MVHLSHRAHGGKGTAGSKLPKEVAEFVAPLEGSEAAVHWLWSHGFNIPRVRVC